MNKNTNAYMRSLKQNWDSICTMLPMRWTDVRMDELAALLNRVIPITPHEKVFRSIIQQLYKINNRAFIMWMKETQCQFLSQIIGGLAIAQCLDLHKVIHIMYNVAGKSFVVSKYDPSLGRTKPAEPAPESAAEPTPESAPESTTESATEPATGQSTTINEVIDNILKTD